MRTDTEVMRHPGRQLLGMVLLISLWSSSASAVSKEIITSATYGVLAGTIVGAATLAFTENPGDNLNRIARGASLGLYAGLILGFYVTYGISGEDEYFEDEEVRLKREMPKFALIPLTNNKGLHGAAGLWNLHSF